MNRFFLVLAIFCLLASKVQANLPIPEDKLRIFIEKIKSCELYELEFKHPLTGEMKSKFIKGIEDNRCFYVETMPENMTLICRFPMDSLTSIAKDYEKAIDDIKNGVSEPSEDISNLEKMMNDPEICIVKAPEKEPTEFIIPHKIEQQEEMYEETIDEKFIEENTVEDNEMMKMEDNAR